MVADALAQRWELGKSKDRFKGRLAEGRADLSAGASGARAPGAVDGDDALGGAPARGPRVAVLWPQTYMNDVGRSVGPARGSYKLPIDRVLVLHDEIDLPFGEVRSRRGGGRAGHKGLKSVSRALGGPGFWRVRVGVGRPDSTDPEIVASYVLSRFRESDAEVGELVDRAREAAERVVCEDAQRSEGARPSEGARQGGGARQADGSRRREDAQR